MNFSVNKRVKVGIASVIAIALLISGCGTQPSGNPSSQAGTEKAPIKIGIVTSQTGALEGYGKQHIRGFELGLEYATKGSKQVAGHLIQVITADTETKPEVAKQKAIKLLENDKVDILVGSASSDMSLLMMDIP